MKYIAITFIFIFFSAFVSAQEDCPIESLDSYRLSISDEDKDKEYIGSIFLPNFNKTNGDFCGYWTQKSLTNNSQHLLTGHKSNYMSITLNPEIYDAGLALEFSNTDTWLQQGKLIKRGIAGVFIGTFTIRKQ